MYICSHEVTLDSQRKIKIIKNFEMLDTKILKVAKFFCNFLFGLEVFVMIPKVYSKFYYYWHVVTTSFITLFQNAPEVFGGYF